MEKSGLVRKRMKHNDMPQAINSLRQIPATEHTSLMTNRACYIDNLNRLKELKMEYPYRHQRCCSDDLQIG